MMPWAVPFAKSNLLQLFFCILLKKLNDCVLIELYSNIKCNVLPFSTAKIIDKKKNKIVKSDKLMKYIMLFIYLVSVGSKRKVAGVHQDCNLFLNIEI